MVLDIQKSIEYYKTFLNFELVQAIPDTEPFEWARIKCGAIEITLQDQANMSFDIPEMQELKTGSTINFHVQVCDIETLYCELKDKVEMSQDINTFFPDIREFRIRDCNGYFWTFEGKVGK
jgi:uncharacterized glyoxalase superfamily protein PhnB